MSRPSWSPLPSRGDGNRYYETTGMLGEPHHVAITPGTLEDRAFIYGLASEDDALTHFMWETYLALNPDAPASDLPSDVKKNFDRVWVSEHKAIRGKPMTDNEVRQQHARMNDIRNPKKEKK